MLNVYRIHRTETNSSALYELSLDNIEKDSWFKLSKPTPEELTLVSEATSVPLDFLTAALDENEHSRIDFEDDYILVIINIPLLIDKNRFDTMPLGIIITRDQFITISLKENKIIDSFIQLNIKNFSTSRKIHFLFLILLKTAEHYLRYMRYINHLTDDLELSLRKSMQNQSLFQLFELERSLVYFITALKDNNVVMEKILRLRKNKVVEHLLTINEEDEDLLEDVIIENKQAIEMVEMHSNILGGMMDAFASIISNNLNIVMKFLTSVTILLAIPTMISSFWGMNVDVPFRNHSGGFATVAVIATVSTALAFTLLWRKKMF
jgi:magnesium transporter